MLLYTEDLQNPASCILSDIEAIERKQKNWKRRSNVWNSFRTREDYTNNAFSGLRRDD